jgi:hypothetical protein
MHLAAAPNSTRGAPCELPGPNYQKSSFSKNVLGTLQETNDHIFQLFFAGKLRTDCLLPVVPLQYTHLSVRLTCARTQLNQILAKLTQYSLT